ncbi:tetratricopeptide repeat protein [Rossellomorea marisflavi]|uniref:Tetratricopeptide repeat protein n=1 Tax=Rossellomorea marisflavi TaxID=189381 RepID=A0A5D4S0J0_9BACI|nr:tetratricopeptide repeat protein [Rossellomorea marisflavi]TYS57153.1 tetratricopeptide repeat protein [Rossellomorea marisflavi]
MKKDYVKAVEQLDVAIALVPAVNRAYTEHEIEMIMTRGAFEYSEGHVEEAIHVYKKVGKVLEEPNRILHDKLIKSRYYYNLARAYTNIGKLEESTVLLTKGIEWGIENEELYTMAEFHYQIGYNYERSNNYERALEFLDQSIALFNLRSENPYETFLADKRTRFLEALHISP